MEQDWLDAIAQEEDDWAAIRAFAYENVDVLARQWRFGDGEGGAVLECLRKVVEELEPWALPRQFDPRPRPASKKKISGNLRVKVFERDEYRCVYCGSWEDLCADHVVAESKGGPTTLENLQTLCRPCNTAKGAK